MSSVCTLEHVEVSIGRKTTYRQTGRHTHRQTHRQTHRHTHTYRHTGRQIDIESVFLSHSWMCHSLCIPHDFMNARVYVSKRSALSLDKVNPQRLVGYRSFPALEMYTDHTLHHSSSVCSTIKASADEANSEYLETRNIECKRFIYGNILSVQQLLPFRRVITHKNIYSQSVQRKQYFRPVSICRVIPTIGVQRIPESVVKCLLKNTASNNNKFHHQQFIL